MKRIISYILMSFWAIVVFADTYDYVFTYGGYPIEVIIRTEMSSDAINYYNNHYTQLFPNATLIGNTSATYNCHSYAWNMVHGGPTCWLNQFKSTGVKNLAYYWEKNDFEETTENYATTVFYYNSDHSAIIKASDRTKYISKWGAMPLMEHAPGYGPYEDMVNRRYYKKVDHSSNVVEGILMPGFGDYLCNREYEFFPSNGDELEMDEKYIYVWTISEEQDDGADAVALGKATLECDEFPHIAKITFLTRGLFTVTVEVYNGDEELLGVFTCQPYVI